MSRDEAGRWLGLEPQPAVSDPAAVAVVRAALRGDLVDERALSAPAFPDFLAALVELAPAAIEALSRSGMDRQMLMSSLADVGRKVRAYGDAGIRGWLIEVLRGEVVALGRLQFEPVPGELGHAIHIPELGPLAPDLVDDALERARRRFGGGARFCCTSWMLDPRLRELGPGSNIVRFQQRFRVFDGEGGRTENVEPDRAVAKFVFGLPLPEVLAPEFTPSSSLQHLVLGVLRAGEHWTEPVGVLRDR